jgi:hypothetical protein
MIWSEHIIARAIALQTLARKCVVLVDNCNWTGHECDVLGVTTDLRIIDVEVKISRADLKADAKKDKWWHRQFWRYGEPEPAHIPRAWPPKVWKHYYAMPFDIWRPELVDALPSKASGILLLREQKNSVTPLAVHVERRATPNKDAKKLTPEQAVDIARLANLRMWEAYRAQEQSLREAERWRMQLKEATV